MSAKKTAGRGKPNKSPKRKQAKKPAPPRKAAPKKKAAPARKGARPVTARRAPAAKAPKKKASAKAAAAKQPVKAKVAPKAPEKKASGKKPPPMVRRDGTGHLDPKYAATLHERSAGQTKDDDRAFFKGSHSSDDLAEELGEEVVEKMTSGEDEGEEVLDQQVTEEDGGPFVETSGKTEFGYETDASNPKGADREPFPRT